jgi:hypothetical protein
MPTRRFTHFVIFAEMRTGSNLLEESLNQFPDLRCDGELFNPVFVGGPNRGEPFGFTLKKREKDPFALLDAIRKADDKVIPGFRFFHNHDPRILKACLEDEACAKVVLTRNPLESYVSRKIAAATDQWKLTNIKHKKSAAIDFDRVEFTEFLADRAEFQDLIREVLQASGQTAYPIRYSDLQSLEILNGLAKYLGSTHRIEALETSLKPQNPTGLREKVRNYDDMRAALADLDPFDVTGNPNFEPARGAGVPRYLASADAPFLFLPIRGALEGVIAEWLVAQGPADAPLTGFNQKTLRDWRLANPGFQAFTVLRHPALRAHEAFCRTILAPDAPGYGEIRSILQKAHGISVPDAGAADPAYDLSAHRVAFRSFLKFVKANLAGQTGLRVDQAWASQIAIVRGAAQICPPAHIVLDRTAQAQLDHMSMLTGRAPVQLGTIIDDLPFRHRDVMDAETDARIHEIYTRDFINFGFGDWRAT